MLTFCGIKQIIGTVVRFFSLASILSTYLQATEDKESTESLHCHLTVNSSDLVLE